MTNSVIRTQRETFMYGLNKYIMEDFTQVIKMQNKNFSIRITFQTRKYVVYLYISVLIGTISSYLHFIEH